MLTSWLPFYLRYYLAPFGASLAEAEAGADGGGFPRWAIYAIGALVLLVCILPVCVIIGLALLGPSIGTVFSNMVEELATPAP